MGSRLFDAGAALCGLILLSPLLAGIAAAVKLQDGGPVFFKGARVGQGGRPFRLYKFRTMIVGAELRGPGITTHQDGRITRLGGWLRRHKLDELPQLLNVLKGDMALVGPRPEDPRYVALYSPNERRVLEVRPGVTSAASIRYHNEETLLSGVDWETAYTQRILPHKLAIEIDYIESRTFTSDLRILLKSVATLLR